MPIYNDRYGKADVIFTKEEIKALDILGDPKYYGLLKKRNFKQLAIHAHVKSYEMIRFFDNSDFLREWVNRFTNSELPEILMALSNKAKTDADTRSAEILMKVAGFISTNNFRFDPAGDINVNILNQNTLVKRLQEGGVFEKPKLETEGGNGKIVKKKSKVLKRKKKIRLKSKGEVIDV